MKTLDHLPPAVPVIHRGQIHRRQTRPPAVARRRGRSPTLEQQPRHVHLRDTIAIARQSGLQRRMFHRFYPSDAASLRRVHPSLHRLIAPTHAALPDARLPE